MTHNPLDSPPLIKVLSSELLLAHESGGVTISTAEILQENNAAQTLEPPEDAAAATATFANVETPVDRARRQANERLHQVSNSLSNTEQRNILGRDDSWLPYLRGGLSYEQRSNLNREFTEELFLRAFQAGNLIIAEHLLARAWVNVRRNNNLLTEYGSVMHAAVATNNADALSMLMRQASDLANSKNRDGLTPFALSIQLDRKDMAALFLEKEVEIDERAIEEAITLGDLNLLQGFAKANVDVFYYLAKSKRNELISSLLNKRIPISFNAVFVAVDNNNLKALQLFQHKGSPVFPQRGNQYSPLTRALEIQNQRAVDFYVDLILPSIDVPSTYINLNLLQAYFTANLKRPHLFHLFAASKLRHDKRAMKKCERLLSACKSTEPMGRALFLLERYLKGQRLGGRFFCGVVPRPFSKEVADIAMQMKSGGIKSVTELCKKIAKMTFAKKGNGCAVEADDLLLPMFAYMRANLLATPASQPVAVANLG